MSDPHDRWRMLLPREWHTITLHPHEARQQRIRALVKERFVGRDDAPKLRRDLEDGLQFQAMRAAENHGVSLALAYEIFPGFPFGGSVLVSFTPDPAGVKLVDLEEQMTAPRTVEYGRQRVVAGDAVRRVRVLPTELEGTEFESTVVDYFVPHLDASGYFGLTFSSAVPDDLREPIVELFDAVAATFHFDVQERDDLVQAHHLAERQDAP